MRVRAEESLKYAKGQITQWDVPSWTLQPSYFIGFSLLLLPTILVSLQLCSVTYQGLG